MRAALVKARAVSRVMEAVREKSCPHLRLLVSVAGAARPCLPQAEAGRPGAAAFPTAFLSTPKLSEARGSAGRGLRVPP
jgi:hypothetical protein